MATKKAFVVGAQVQLISGGPVMTVSEVDARAARVRCIWFAGKKRESAYFETGTLKHVDADA